MSTAAYVHTAECARALAEARALNAPWEARWPDYCRKCYGTGIVTFWHTPGDPCHGQEQLTEPCAECTEKGLCARCKGPLTDPEDGDGPCTACGWNYDDMLPAGEECFCQYDRALAPQEPAP